MSVVRVVIVEDEALALRSLRTLLESMAGVELVGEATAGPDAVGIIDRLRPDLVFLDIQLPGFDGLEVLRRLSHAPSVVFTTAFDRYAVSAFEFEALDYLLKPFSRQRLVTAIERARKAARPRDAHELHESARRVFDGPPDAPLVRFLVRERGRLVPVSVKHIVRLEADDDYVRVYAQGRVHLVYLTLNDFERRLDPGRFVRVHRAHIVNFDFVAHLVPFDGSRIQVELKDGSRVLASRARSRGLRELAL